MEVKVIRPFYHKHPLFLKENVSKEERVDCYVCGNHVADLEMAYICTEHHCSSINRRIILHKKCGELPSQIRHPKHPHHPIYLFDFHLDSEWHVCSVCRRGLYKGVGYRCSSCDFDLHTRCSDALIEERKELEHPSHPHHPLTLMRRPAFAFRCDGCGAQDVDMAYICSTFEFMVHKTCALLPTILPTDDHHHHHHHLSLAFSFPNEYLKYEYRCDVCDKYFDKTCWVYFCGDCRYFVHIKCVGSTTKPDSNSFEDKDVIEFPLDANDISSKLITPFVMRETGLDHIPEAQDTASNSILILNYQEHPLSLVSNLSDKDEEDEEEEEDVELKICEVCVTPISSPPYYHCTASTCTYFIHSICSCLLTNTSLSSSNPNYSQLYGDCQNIPNKKHNFTLHAPSLSKGRDAISFWSCDLCGFPTNGMGYKCEECRMEIDVKCASLPTNIRHASHPHHNKPLLLTRIPSQQQKDGTRNKCRGCNSRRLKIGYCCSDDECDFVLDLKCALLPKSIREREWDKHPLPLTFDASLDHPSDFFCEFCELEMHPKKWMYHCRRCDLSLHLHCLDNLSGWYRNMKTGGRYELKIIHPDHPLTFTYITRKRRCDVCHRYVYTYLGFECAPCYFVVCRRCGDAALKRI